VITDAKDCTYPVACECNAPAALTAGASDASCGAIMTGKIAAKGGPAADLTEFAYSDYQTSDWVTQYTNVFPKALYDCIQEVGGECSAEIDAAKASCNNLGLGAYTCILSVTFGGNPATYHWPQCFPSTCSNVIPAMFAHYADIQVVAYCSGFVTQPIMAILSFAVIFVSMAILMH